MENLNFPAYYAPVSSEEEQTIVGGGELSDALGDFFGNLHFADFVFSGTFIAVSFTFVPLLLFNVIKAGYGLAHTVSSNISALLGLRDEAVTQLKQSSASGQ